MYKYWFILFIYVINQRCVYSFEESFSHLYSLKTTSTDEQQTKEAQGVINRIIPEKANLFTVIVNSNYSDGYFDKFTIIKKGENVEITGNTGVAVTWGFNYYLKYYCNSQIGWQVQHINVPDNLPDVNITIVSKDRFRYYQNVCTTSYSFVWWNLKDWRKHIDWMALNGINIALAPHGQEVIWQRIYKKINLTDEEIKEHFSGPAFLSWQRMGNIRGWGGPLSDSWHQYTLTLQKFLVNSMNNLGMIPALPAFAGFVPTGFQRLFPNVNFSTVEPWLKFDENYCCPLYLDPIDPLFNYIGKMFLTEITEEFGRTHVYYSDSFNEIKPTSDDVEFLKNVGEAIFQTMIDVDSDAIWMLQNWMFVNAFDYWTQERASSFLTSAPKGRMLILDLHSEQLPQFERFDMYFGQPFIWNMLHNFGGTLGMFGKSDSVNTNVYETRNNINSTMVGIGITPEGINQNYVIYDLMLEVSLYNNSVDLNAWIRNYSIRRNGMYDENLYQAWKTLINTVYNYNGSERIDGQYVITIRPTVDIKTWVWYPKNDLVEVWRLFLSANKSLHESEGYRHDLVDITRQYLQYQGDQIYPLIIEAFNDTNVKNLTRYSELLLELFDDLEHILSSNKDFLLGNWLNSAKSISQNEQDKKLFEYNARNQITLWGPNGEIVDYANKQWSGVVSDYFRPRWEIFLSTLQDCLNNNVEFNNTLVELEMFNKVEQPFTFKLNEYPTQERGDSFEISQALYNKWLNIGDRMPDVPMKTIYRNSTFIDFRMKGNILHRELQHADDNNNEKGFELNVPHVVLVP